MLLPSFPDVLDLSVVLRHTKSLSVLRNPTEGIFSLKDEAPKPRPRAWERAPKSPVLARHHGRKVWKRYEAPVKPETKEGLRDDEQTRQVLGDVTNTPRPVKRLRLKNAPKVEIEGREHKAAQYCTTLRDKDNAGTPRRECCRQYIAGCVGLIGGAM